MDVTVNIFGIGGIVILAIFVGYFVGRSERKALKREAEADAVEIQDEIPEKDMYRSDRRRGNNERRIPLGKSIASPVSGKVRLFCEGGRKGVVIEPEQNMVYAPMSGKIIKLYPMGNAFVLHSDEQSGVKELLIQVGRNTPDELCSMYYRPGIVQNEIVNKGKLLLTFDKERLQAAGEDVSVLVGLITGTDMPDVRVTQQESVKVGDELMWIRDNA